MYSVESADCYVPQGRWDSTPMAVSATSLGVRYDAELSPGKTQRYRQVLELTCSHTGPPAPESASSSSSPEGLQAAGLPDTLQTGKQQCGGIKSPCCHIHALSMSDTHNCRPRPAVTVTSQQQQQQR